MPTKQEVAVIRELAAQVAEIAALPIQEDKRRLWRKLNGLKPERPMVCIDQVCWNEMHIGDELKVQSTTRECQTYEWRLRTILYQWRHFPVDMVVEPFILVPKAINNTHLGMKIEEQTSVTDPTSDVVGHKFENQFKTMEDVQKIKMPVVTHDEKETTRRLAVAQELFGGLLEIRLNGEDPNLTFWDLIAMWMGVENALYAIIDQPELIHAILGRMRDGYLSMIDQLDANGLFCQPHSVIHCTGAHTDELPAPGYNPDKPRAKDVWMFQLAQMLATVSPDMFRACMKTSTLVFGKA